MDIRELRQRRADLVAQARALLDGADEEGRGLTDEEQEQYDDLVGQVDALTADIERRERLADLERDLGQSAGRQAGGMEDPRIGMSERETQRYSLLRAIRAAATGDWRGAGLELEASRAVAQHLKREPRGFFVPFDWMVRQAGAGGEQRDLVVGTDTAGGYTVSTDLLADSFIELLRNRMVVRTAGATVLAGLIGDVAIPRQTGGATAYWVAESGAPTESQQAFDQVALTPHTVGAFTDISRKLLLQSSLDIEAFVRSDLATALALAIDYAALHGSGSSNQPTGVAHTTGIGSVAGGTNGAAPTWAHIVQLETEVAVDNADIGRLAYVTNAKVRGKLKQTEKASGTDLWVWTDGANPLNGYRALVSNQVRSDLDKGTSTGVCSAIFFGNWADLLIGMWGTLDILVDPYTGSTSGTVRVVAFQDVDVTVRHPESFGAMLDALTS